MVSRYGLYRGLHLRGMWWPGDPPQGRQDLVVSMPHLRRAMVLGKGKGSDRGGRMNWADLIPPLWAVPIWFFEVSVFGFTVFMGWLFYPAMKKEWEYRTSGTTEPTEHHAPGVGK